MRKLVFTAIVLAMVLGVCSVGHAAQEAPPWWFLLQKLPSETYQELLDGIRQRAPVESGEKKITRSISFLSLTEEISYERWYLVRENGDWSVERARNRDTKEERYMVSFLWLWLPLIFTFLASISVILAPVKGIDVNRYSLLYVYVSLFAGVLAGAIFGKMLGNTPQGMAAAMVAGLITGFIAVGSAGEILQPAFQNGDVFGCFVGVFTGLFAGMFAGDQDYAIIGQYCIFLLKIELFSFIVAQLIAKGPMLVKRLARKRNCEG